ncbi:MAG: hypothetical protein ACHP84_00210 [Caulobacterales bacterium]
MPTTTLDLRRNLRDSIDADIAERTKAHQARIAGLKVGAANLMLAKAPAAAAPLVMLAHGDSWFDYPLDGNGISLGTTDVVAQLTGMGAINPVVLNLSHFGDATTDEMSLPKQQRMIQALTDPANWAASGKPDAILFSGGGNDIAGERFCIFLDYNTAGSTGLDPKRFADMLGMIEGSYLDLFSFRDQYAPGVPVFGHDYDFPIPNGAHPICAGPWLQPSLVYRGWTNLADGTRIVRDALIAFNTLLTRLAADPANDFHLVPTQGTLAPPDWANELHPYPTGFKAIAAKFVAALAQSFPGRI